MEDDNNMTVMTANDKSGISIHQKKLSVGNPGGQVLTTDGCDETFDID